MKYQHVYIDAIGYELPTQVVTTDELELELEPVYRALRMAPGQLESLTGVGERRWWDRGYAVSDGAIAAARKALTSVDFASKYLDVVIYAGVCRELLEPATACRVAAALGVSPDCAPYDLSNACLGVLNGMIDVANRIELGQIRAGLVVSCESAREINELAISQLLAEPTPQQFRASLATFTGGSGAVALLLTDGTFGHARRRRLVGGASQSAPQHHDLCRWGFRTITNMPRAAQQFTQFFVTDSVAVLKHGVELGRRSFAQFLQTLAWSREHVDKVICHQVGKPHRDTILESLGLGTHQDFCTFPYLGNIGTVSLPLTAALAERRGFLRADDRVGFLGIGSGLNCLMLGIEW